MEQVKTMGGFTCPHCKNLNLCDCKTCKPFYEKHGTGSREYAVWTEDGNDVICQYCNQPFSLDESFEAEYEEFKKSQKNESDIFRTTSTS